MFCFVNGTITKSVFNFQCRHSGLLFASNGMSEMIFTLYTCSRSSVFQAFVKLVKVLVLAETDIQHSIFFSLFIKNSNLVLH
jgi:hypothetical protein